MADLAPWHDFAILIGTAFATLIGLLFVSASVGAGVFNPERQYALRVFLSQSVVHFSAGLAIALIVVAPLPSAHVVGTLVLATALFGAAYAGVTGWRMVHHHLIETLDLADRLWYRHHSRHRLSGDDCRGGDAVSRTGCRGATAGGHAGAAADRRHPQCLGHHDVGYSASAVEPRRAM